jgi:DnaJ like chaperone protein
MKWLYVVFAIIYSLFPYDLLPDFIAGLGWVDDLIVIALVLRFLYLQLYKPHHTKSDSTTEYQRQSSGGGKGADDDVKGSSSRFDSADPYTVLGIDESASEETIKGAYRELVGQYHPDKVAHLGEEFKRLAEERFKQIQQAYQNIQHSRRRK